MFAVTDPIPQTTQNKSRYREESSLNCFGSSQVGEVSVVLVIQQIHEPYKRNIVTNVNKYVSINIRFNASDQVTTEI